MTVARELRLRDRVTVDGLTGTVKGRSYGSYPSPDGGRIMWLTLQLDGSGWATVELDPDAPATIHRSPACPEVRANGDHDYEDVTVGDRVVDAQCTECGRFASGGDSPRQPPVSSYGPAPAHLRSRGRRDPARGLVDRP